MNPEMMKRGIDFFLRDPESVSIIIPALCLILPIAVVIAFVADRVIQSESDSQEGIHEDLEMR